MRCSLSIKEAQRSYKGEEVTRLLETLDNVHTKHEFVLATEIRKCNDNEKD